MLILFKVVGTKPLRYLKNNNDKFEKKKKNWGILSAGIFGG